MSRLGSIVSLMLQGFQQSLSMHLWWSNGVESLWSLGLHHPKRAPRFPHSAFIMMRLPSSARWRFSSRFKPLSIFSAGEWLIHRRCWPPHFLCRIFRERSTWCDMVKASRLRYCQMRRVETYPRGRNTVSSLPSLDAVQSLLQLADTKEHEDKKKSNVA